MTMFGSGREEGQAVEMPTHVAANYRQIKDIDAQPSEFSMAETSIHEEPTPEENPACESGVNPGEPDAGEITEVRPKEGPLVRKIKSLNKFVDATMPGLDPISALLWLVMLRHAFDGVVAISHKRLASTVAVSKRTVIRHLEILEGHRLIKKLKIGGKGRGTNRYRLGQCSLVPREKPTRAKKSTGKS